MGSARTVTGAHPPGRGLLWGGGVRVMQAGRLMCWPLAAAAAAGTFGRVLECWDRKVKDYVAVKIVRNVDKYRHAAMIEVGVAL